MKQGRLLVAVVVLWGTSAVALNRGLGDPPPDIDRSTPLSTVEGFLKSAHAGQYEEAAHFLSLDHVPLTEQPTVGARLARHLRFVLDHHSWLDLEKITKNPEGDPEKKKNVEDLGVIPLRKLKVALRLARVKDGTIEVWVFDRETVRAIDGLYDQYGPPFGDRMPEFLTSRSWLDLEAWQWIGLGILGLAAMLIGRLGEAFLLSLARRMTHLTRVEWDEPLVESGRGSLRLPLVAAVLELGAGPMLLPPDSRAVVDLLARSLAIVSLGWFTVRFINLGSGLLRIRLDSEREHDPLAVRGLETQLAVLRRLLVIGCYLLTGALLLLQFESVRTLGVSLLASAGVAGLAIGFAAQRTLATVFAGVQLSITQPVRIGDTVVVESEFGTVEEIRLTYAVVRLWDLRRMVVPITYFLEKPFQNWSKSGTDILGAVTLQVDYSASIDAFRNEVKRILETEGRGLWDGKMQGVQVTEASDRTQTLRVLVSARDASTNWDLRCLVREQLIQFLKKHPTWVPVQRTMPLPLPLPSAPQA